MEISVLIDKFTTCLVDSKTGNEVNLYTLGGEL
jgi:hypothetical protein